MDILFKNHDVKTMISMCFTKYSETINLTIRFEWSRFTFIEPNKPHNFLSKFEPFEYFSAMQLIH